MVNYVGKVSLNGTLNRCAFLWRPSFMWRPSFLWRPSGKYEIHSMYKGEFREKERKKKKAININSALFGIGLFKKLTLSRKKYLFLRLLEMSADVTSKGLDSYRLAIGHIEIRPDR